MLRSDFRLARPALVAVAFSLLAFAGQAHAAEAADAAAAEAAGDGDGLEQIVVTAEKRSTNLQETPIAISVLGSEQLANRHVQSLLDLGDGAIPSLRVAPFFSRGSALVMNIRGIGVLSDSNQPARDQGVGVYIDGVYLGRAQGLGSALYDIENIEVLKGPQGTLFGRNTEGGAVNIVTRRPSGEFKLRAAVGIGNFGSDKGEVHVDLPEFSNIAIKVDAVLQHRNGTVDNPYNAGEDFNVATRQGIHAEALWKPFDGFSANYAFDTSYDGSTPLYAQATSLGSLPRAPITPIQPQRASTAVVGAVQQLSVGKTHGHRLTFDWQVTPEILLKSINSYRKLDQSQYDNGSGISSALSATGNFAGVGFGRYSLAMFKQDQKSSELQAIGDFNRVKFVAGALYYREHVEDNAQAFNTLTVNDAAGTTYSVLTIDPTTQRIDRASRVTTESLGAFAQVTITPPIGDDILHVTGGARYSHDKKVGELFIVNNAAPNVDGVIGPRGLNASWSRVDPLVNVALDAAEDVHLYGKWSSGFKAGGANSRSLRYAPFNPETVSMFELGAKTEFWGNRARLNVAAYSGDYKDIQLDFSAQYQQIINGVLLTTTRTTTETTNAPGKGKIKGIEADFMLNPATGLTLSASYAYTKVTIPATVNPFPQSNGAFITVPIPIYAIYTPEHAASGSIDYETPMAGGKLTFHLDANLDSGFYANYTDPGFNTTTGQVTVSQPKGDKSFIVNGRIALADLPMNDGSARLTIAAWARNLFNEQHAFYRSFSPLAGGTGIFNEPRTFGIELGVSM